MLSLPHLKYKDIKFTSKVKDVTFNLLVKGTRPSTGNTNYWQRHNGEMGRSFGDFL